MSAQFKHNLRQLKAFVFLAALGLAGCGAETAPLAHVSGKVLLNGKPLTSGNVQAHPAEGRAAGGPIQPDGTFELGTHELGDGALIGTHKAAVVAYQNENAANPEAPVGKSLVPKRYTNPETSGLTIEVQADGENSAVLELVSP